MGRRDKKKNSPVTSLSVDTRENCPELDHLLKTCKYDDVSFDKWCAHHDSLDLERLVFVSREEAVSGCEKTISMSRLVECPDSADNKLRKEKFTHSFMVHSSAQDGDVIEFTKLGDRRFGSYGNLRIVLKIKGD